MQYFGLMLLYLRGKFSPKTDLLLLLDFFFLHEIHSENEDID